MSEQEQPEPEPEADEAPDEEAVADLAAAIEGNEAEFARLTERLEDVNELLDVLALATGAMDDEMVEKLAATGTNLGAVADAAAEPATARGVESLLHAVGDATGELEEPPERVGIVGLLRAMRDPEVQAGMGFLVDLAGNLGADLTRRSELRREFDGAAAAGEMAATLADEEEEPAPEAAPEAER